MTPKRTSPARQAPAAAPLVRVVLISLDSHLSGAIEAARRTLNKAAPSIELSFYAASDWGRDPSALAACKASIASGDIIIASMLFMDEHIRAVLPALEARREHCDAMIGALSAAEVVKLTRLGGFHMDKPASGPIALLKRLRGKSPNGSSGAGQMKMLRQVPKFLKFIPGKAQDVRAYFLTLQYWLAGSEANIANLVLNLVNRYAAGPRAALKGTLNPAPPADYPDVGVYHPGLAGRIAEDLKSLPKAARGKPTVGLLVMRSYLLSGDAAHYDAVIAALEAKGLHVVTAFASGLDQRPAIEKFFLANGRASVDAVVSLTGFSLVGGPAYNDTGAAQEILSRLDVPYIAAHALEFQSLPEWAEGAAGLSPVETTIMVAIPELDGAIQPTVFGGRVSSGGTCKGCARRCVFPAHDGGSAMRACPERAETLAARVARLVALRRAERAEKKIGVVLFNFPPNAGATGSAAFLAVFESLWNTLAAMKREGYTVDLPESVDALRDAILKGNAERFGTDANVHERIAAAVHVRREPHLKAIEAQWGPAPGRQLSNGAQIFILGHCFGNVFVGVQPSFGYEGDPMRLLFEKSFAPTHAFAAFYRWLRDDFGAHAVLHFGTHGALEFMPGKQVGPSESCWPDRLICDMPNFYLYAANNPTEGALAKRRSGATLISHLTPAVSNAGLYRELSDLKSTIDRWRMTPQGSPDLESLSALILDQAAMIGVSGETVEAIARNLATLERSLIPEGLHVVGAPMSADMRAATLTSIVAASERPEAERLVVPILEGATAAQALKAADLSTSDADLRALAARLEDANRHLSEDHEIAAIIRALDGGFIAPAPGGDLIRTPEMLPTGRNIHGFDPFRMPSAFAMKSAGEQAARLLERHFSETGALPETVALVLWGADNMKSEGAQLAQALALMGARPRFDSYGRLCGASLTPLAELGRPRIDVVATLSGIFRDLLPLQTRMLAEAALLAVKADEPAEQNFIRKHALACMAAEGCDIETAALRVFSNATGAYGANVNQLVDSSAWRDEDELAEAFTRRKCFAYGVCGAPAQQPAVLQSLLAHVDVAYQNLESVELGVTTIDHYFDTLGGIGRAVKRAKGADAALYISDQTASSGAVRTLKEQVALETHTRTLNPKWYEGMLRHGFEGVRQIEANVTNTMGWSATTGEVPSWVYQKITETYVLDADLRERLAKLNPKSCARVANRLIEASERKYWSPDPDTLAALKRAGEDLEDRLEGVAAGAAA
ncbi:MAG: magnesium chelatase subunit H [Parvularculaceae bacterium]